MSAWTSTSAGEEPQRVGGSARPGWWRAGWDRRPHREKRPCARPPTHPARHEDGGNGWERRPLVGTAGRRPAGDVPLVVSGDRGPGAFLRSVAPRANHPAGRRRAVRCAVAQRVPTRGRRSKPTAPPRRSVDPPDCIFTATGLPGISPESAPRAVHAASNSTSQERHAFAMIASSARSSPSIAASARISSRRASAIRPVVSLDARPLRGGAGFHPAMILGVQCPVPPFEQSTDIPAGPPASRVRLSP